MAKIKLIEVKSDLGGRLAGASLGPDAIRIASYSNNQDYNFYARFSNNLYTKIVAPNALFHIPVIHPFARRAESILSIIEQTCDAVSHGMKESEVTIVLSGDHSTASGSIAGVKKAYPNKRIGVIWIDAHTDVHTPYTSDTGNMHGMPIATAINDNNIECMFNELDAETIEIWEHLKGIGGTKEKVNMSDVVYIAIRDYEQAEASLINKYKNKIFRTFDVRLHGAKNIAMESLKCLSHCDIIYVSFDVDSMDPSVSTGTGTPFENGLHAYEAKEILKTLLAVEKVKCIEISEVNPVLDTTNTMGKTAFSILKNICRVIDLRT